MVKYDGGVITMKYIEIFSEKRVFDFSFSWNNQ